MQDMLTRSSVEDAAPESRKLSRNKNARVEAGSVAPLELQNRSLSHIRGFNYHPSFASHGITRWIDRFDAARIELELARGKELFPWMNTVRIWLSLDAWRDDRRRFLDNLDTEVGIIRRLGLRVMPMLFNGISNIPDYGCLNKTDVDRLMKADGGANLRTLYLDYVADIARRYATDEVVAVWDLCNEPGLHYTEEGDPTREGFFTLFRASADELRKHGVTAPIGVGNWGAVADDVLCIDFVDCLLTHRYRVPHCMTVEKFRENVTKTVEFANLHNLPWCVSECTWGNWDDQERAKLLSDLEVFLEAGAGVIPYALWESPAMDAHSKSGGVHYGWGAPEDLSFIRRNGDLRPGHDVINDIMVRYPLEHLPPPAGPAKPVSYSSFWPGQVWQDTDGNPIQAHGGGILKVRDTWFWFGENKAAPTCVNSRGIARTPLIGVSCYSSKDLYNWKNEGLALGAVTGEPGHELSPANILERPKVIYNSATKKFVMWFHLDSEDYSWARTGVAVADTVTGPYQYLGSMRPCGQEARDLTLYKDDDGKAYLIYTSENNETIHIAALDDEYLRPIGEPHRILAGMVREAPAIFKRDGFYFLITSGCTGWADNRAMLATAENLMGKWLVLAGGDVCVGDPARANVTFSSQSTFALTVEHDDGRPAQVIFMADRWNPADLGDSRYVWLPVDVKSRFASIRWHDSWSLADHPTQP
jgi:hypothetical protein